jgi:predicted Zn finger-like uncharacterized protein
MYTQCPECGTAFRVTAEVLRQAAGRVRCGGCGNAFNALDFLSEDKPAAPVPPAHEDGLAGEATEPPRLEADEPPETISAERSAALLKTLDELAGSDIRIEDTGIEWRVLDADDEDEEPQALEDDAPEVMDDTGSMRWFIDESPTPVDEQLSDEPGDIDAPEIFEPVKGSRAGGEMRFDDDTPLPADFDFDSEPAESDEPPAIEVRETPAVPDMAQVDLALGEPEDWEDLLGEVDEPVEAREPEYASEPEYVGEHIEEVEPEGIDDDEPLPDVDTQFATQAEAMGIDLSGVHARVREAGEDAAGEPTIDDELIAAAFEAEARAGEDRNEDEPGDAEELAADDEYDEFEDLELEIEEPADLIEPRDRELVARSDEDATLAAELGLDEDEYEDEVEVEDLSTSEDVDKPEHVVPPMTEEEQTINMMIDQDLLAFAVEDEDGFASTIVQKQRSGRDELPEKQDGEEAEAEAAEVDFDKDSPLVETIIMEGEFVRDAFEEERLEEERRKAAEAGAVESPEAGADAGQKQEKPDAKEPLNYRMVAGIAALALLLGAQYVHQSRESLAVHPAFNSSVGSVYRMLGKPLTPAWDITGWRFEATKGSTDESDAVLTIYSRIGNNSAEALPYPLINVSLTDRYEEIIGSKVLEPGDYLAESLDTREPVAPGQTFSAVISIEAPDANATGFKLNVCYRQPGGRLRCAIDDFK